MHIENVGQVSIEQVKSELSRMEKGQLLAQEVAQKAAIHVLNQLLRIGCSEQNAHAILRSLNNFAVLVGAECKRRGIATVDHPEGN